MSVVDTGAWRRVGVSLVWDPRALGAEILAGEAVSLRGFMQMAQSWPEALPSNGGDAVLMAGLEAALDCLSPSDAEIYLQRQFAPVLESFQAHYQLQAALLIWLPSGKRRIQADAAFHSYHWLCAAPHGNERIPLGRLLWSGAESDAKRIVDRKRTSDWDESAWLGLHQARVS